jgi:hypothetical protein
VLLRTAATIATIADCVFMLNSGVGVWILDLFKFAKKGAVQTVG